MRGCCWTDGGRSGEGGRGDTPSCLCDLGMQFNCCF